MNSHILILSGPSGAGKTALCQRVANAARAQGMVVRGVLSPPRVFEDVKIGIDVLDLSSGERRPLAESGAAAGGPATAGWRFHAGSLAWGTDVLCRSVPCDLLMVDELGPLELQRGEGWAEAIDLLRTGDYRWAVVVVRPGLVERFLALVREPAVTIVTVTREDQDKIFEHIARLWS